MTFNVHSGAQNQLLEKYVQHVDTSDLSSTQCLYVESEVFTCFKHIL